MPLPFTSTPWGAPQQVRVIAEGIISVSTARHGGIYLSPERMEQMPAHYRDTWAGAPWYEEDQDWCMVAVTFPDCFQADPFGPDAVEIARKIIGGNPEYFKVPVVVKTELTPCGEQAVIPGCERQTTEKNPQGNLW